MGPSGTSQVGYALRKEQEEAVNARAEETDGRFVAPDNMPLLPNSLLVLLPLYCL